MEFAIQTLADIPIAIASLTGRVDAANSHELRREFDRCMETTSWFVFDCEALDFIDSSGLGAIVACLRKALSAGGDIYLAGVKTKVYMVFELTQAVRLFSFFSDTETALAAFSGPRAQPEAIS